MLTDSTHTELLIEEKGSPFLKIIAAVCAVLITAIFIGGYAYLRKRHTQQRIAATQEPEVSQKLPKGPARAHILVDDPMLKGGQSIIGGAVKNISDEKLTFLTVSLELRRRNDASLEDKSLPVTPADLDPGQEGRYVLMVPPQHYSSVRLVGLRSGPDSGLVVYTSAQGQKRPPERLEPKVVVIPRSGGKGEFLNTPDNPARVP